MHSGKTKLQLCHFTIHFLKTHHNDDRLQLSYSQHQQNLAAVKHVMRQTLFNTTYDKIMFNSMVQRFIKILQSAGA